MRDWLWWETFLQWVFVLYCFGLPDRDSKYFLSLIMEKVKSDLIWSNMNQMKEVLFDKKLSALYTAVNIAEQGLLFHVSRLSLQPTRLSYPKAPPTLAEIYCFLLPKYNSNTISITSISAIIFLTKYWNILQQSFCLELCRIYVCFCLSLLYCPIWFLQYKRHEVSSHWYDFLGPMRATSSVEQKTVHVYCWCLMFCCS